MKFESKYIFFIQENASEKVVCERVAILSGGDVLNKELGHQHWTGSEPMLNVSRQGQQRVVCVLVVCELVGSHSVD